MDYKRVTLLCGHYGSGKTNVAVNMALDLKKRYDSVAVADLDIVNPYFRTKDSAKDFEENGIRLIVSEYANSNLDIPALPQDMYAITDDKSLHVIIDVGGDDRGALALGRIAPALIEENDYEMLLVVNKFRPLTPDAASTIEVMREIEAAGGIRFTGIANNSNLGDETTADDVLASLQYADEVSELSGLPVVMTTVKEDLYNELSGKIENLFPMKLQARPID
ncbi:MAG: hypothetical protein Q3968_02540 [Clostridiaceae bacterium]|nr:hypothetical protein [Clostridiaceae bacterium]